MKAGEAMARPAKAVNVQSRNLTNAEKEARTFLENAVKGKKGALEPPEYFTGGQKAIFKYIVDQLDECGILGSLDVYILTSCAIAIDRLENIERRVNEDESLMSDSALMATKDKYTKDLYRCCNELCLSPQARAKIGSLAAQAAKQREDPLLKALREDD
ncbi:MAG: P27 family phage terminase small subunit [Anaerotruncus rubiinfantis]|jgi:P27 family predicted phage terminase small subunit